MAPRRSYPKTTGPMDQWLESQGYYRKHTARDGTCLFRAVSEQVFYTQAVHHNVRRQCVEFIKKNKDIFQEFMEETIEDYVTRMLSTREWGGQMEINALSLLYHYDVLVFEEVGKPPNVATKHGFSKKLLLCFSSDNHYDSVYPKLYIVKAAFCQSLAYEVLYKNVFQLPDVNYAVNKMLHDKTNRVQKERLLNEDHLISCGRFGFSMEISLEPNREYIDSDDSQINVKELLAQGSTPFPYKVAKALDPNIYRNIEFDIWNDFRREMKFGWYRNNGELQVGVKCLVKLNPERSFHAHIQEMTPDKGPVVVFVEELGEKCTVSYENLEPLPMNEKTQWALPYKHCRQLSNIQQKSALLAFTEFGGKWKKSKIGKSRKIKENAVHTPLSPRLQYNSKINAGPVKYSTQHNARFIQEQLAFQNYSPESFNNVQNYNNVGVDMSSLPVSLVLEQPKSNASPVISQAMIMSMTPQTSVASNHMMSCVSKSGDLINNNSERCLSPIQQPDSTTTEVPCSQQSMMESQLQVDAALCSSPPSLSPTHFLSFPSYPNSPSLTPHSQVSTSVPRPEPNTTNPGIMNSSSNFNDTVCTKSTSPYVVCNTSVSGVNVGFVGVNRGNDQLPRDMNGNLLFQPVNFMAQKSMQPSGNDLPLSDIPTLRFYYNLGHDYFRLSCMCWPNSVPQSKSNFVSTCQNTPNYSENQNFGSTGMSAPTTEHEHHMPDSTTSIPEDIYHLGQEVSPNLMLSNDHNVQLSNDPDKAVFHTNNVENESVSWQPKQAEDASKSFQKSRIRKNTSDGREIRIQNTHVGRAHPNLMRNDSYEMQTSFQQPEDLESTCAHNVNDTRTCGQNSVPTLHTTNYNVPPPPPPPPPFPYTFTPMTPTMYNHTMVPFYFPVETEQGMMPVSYYPQYTLTSPMPVAQQDTPDISADVQTSQSHFSGPLYGQIQQQSGNVENGCVPPFAIYSQPSPPVMFPQSPTLPTTVFPTGTGPIANVSVQRWLQTTQGSPHLPPTPCMFQSQPSTPPPGASITFNTPA